jgi:MSHA biogenesis protein MshQ
MKKRLLFLAFGWLLVLGLLPTAQAANYVFPGTLPAGCSGTGPTYSCGALTLGNNDTIVIDAPRPATITFSGNFSTDNAKINQGGLTTSLSLVVNGVLTAGYQSVVNANVTANSVTGGDQAVFGGDVTATTGSVSLTYKSTVAGSVTANSGSISLANQVEVSGGLNTTTGAVNLAQTVKVTSDITTTSGTVVVGQSSVVSGGVVSTTGTVQINYQAQVLGSINTQGSITLDQGSIVGGNVVGGAASVSVGYAAQVSGGVSSTSGAISLAQNSVVNACVKSSNSVSITLGLNAKANAVCCGATCGNSCVANNSNLAMPPSCTSQIIAEYRMDETSWNGTTGEVKDSSGNGAHGTARIANGSTAVASTVGGSPAYSTASQSTCRFGDFDTSSGTVRTYSYVELPAMPSLSSGFSVTAWMRSTDVTASGQRIFVRDDNQDGWAISMGDGGTGKLRFFSRRVANSGSVTGGSNPNAGAFAIDTNAVISANSWYFVAATVDNTSKTVTLYVYNATGTQIAKASSLYSGTWADGTGMAAMGGETSASSEGRQANFHFKGNLDEVAFFTGAQTQAQIEARITQVRTCAVAQTCVVDDFTSGTLNPALWNPVAVGGTFTPQVVDVGGQKRLRMTTAGTNQATLVQLKKWFPGAGNKIVVQFDQYAYGGNGADGVGVVFSDASVAPAPGGNGGSLGYAQRSGVNGYAGGWLGVGIDEFGNYPSPTEGRGGYPGGWSPPVGAALAAGVYKNSVAVRGSGSGAVGYSLLANSGTLSPAIWTSGNTSATLQKFRITIDNTNNVNAFVTVQRDSTGTGSSYTTVIPTFDARGTNSGQAVVPANWLVSFTGGTGGSTNIHELANISICATYVNDPGGSTNASAFDCVETGANLPWTIAARKPLYTKRAGVDFKLDVAALKSDGSLESNYVAAGGNSKYVKVELFDDVTPPASCSAYTSPLASQTVTFASGSYSSAAGRALTSNFNVAATYSKLRCRVRECTDSSCGSFTTTVAAACSSDQFSVRPSVATLSTSATAAAPSTTATPVIAAGGNFTLRAVTTPTTYARNLALDIGRLTAQDPSTQATQQAGGTVGTLAASSLTGNAAAVSTSYSEVGYLYLAPGAYRDDSLTAVDAAQGDCVTDTTGNKYLSDALDASGKYGCAVGNTVALSLGRFRPDHFAVSVPSVTPFCGVPPSNDFTYFGQDGFATNFTLTAQTLTNVTTKNYRGVFAKFNLANYAAYGFTTAAALPSGSALLASATVPAGAWVDGVASNVVARHQVSRPTAAAAETLVAVNAAPTDGEASASTTAVGTNVRLRYGRLRMQNAYGSELLDLPIPFEAQYWTGISYVTNTWDSCTVLPMSSLVMSNFTGGLIPCKTQIMPIGNQTLSGGKLPGGLKLTKPGQNYSGSVDLAFNVSNTAAGNTCLSTTSSAATAANQPWFGPNIGGRATFGIYRSPLIYLRENY